MSLNVSSMWHAGHTGALIPLVATTRPLRSVDYYSAQIYGPPIFVLRLVPGRRSFSASFRVALVRSVSLVWKSKPRNAEDFVDAFQDRTGGGS
jgi:hypothetical protein